MATVTATALTKRQKDVLSFICRFIRDNGFSPTVREIGVGLGGMNTNGVMCHIKALDRKGLIRRGEPNTSRALVPIMSDGSCPFCGK